MSVVKRLLSTPLRRTFSWNPNLSRTCSTETTDLDKKGGFAKAFEKFQGRLEQPKKPDDNFASMLKNSKFIDLGDPDGKVVTGKIFHIVDDDLYIDFGWKFHCVCPRPKKNAPNFVRGAKVRLRIRELELSSKFLGYEKDLTLLEADCILLGLVQDKERVEKN